MRKTWTTLVVLGILLCMFVSLGASAQAAEDALTILAVNGEALTDEQFAALKNEYTNGYILDVSGNGTNSAFDIVFAEAHAVETGAVGPIPEEHETETLFLGAPMTLEANGEKITLIGVNYEVDYGALTMMMESAEGKVVAVGNANGGEGVKSAGIGLFLTTDADDGVQTLVTANVGVTQVVNVGKDSAYPITKVTLDANGDLQAEPMAAPGSFTEMAPGPEVDPGFTDPSFEEPAVCNVYYDGNGADDGWVETSQVTEGNELTLPDNGFTREGYEFTGWDVNGGTYAPYETITVEGDTTVIAQWQEVFATYTATYDGNGADGGWTEPSSVSEAAQLTLPECGFTRTGYTFAGWKLNDTTYQPYESLYLSGDTTFYAEWNQDYVPATYTVSFDPNGAESGSMSEAEVTEGNAYTLPENGYTREGYTFAGWNVNSATYQPYEAVSITADVTVTAQWDENPVEPAAVTISLTYQAGEGTGEAYTVNQEGDQFTLDQFSFTAPEGKHFVNWTVNGTPYDAGASITLTESAVAEAVYEADVEPAATDQDAGIQNGTDMRTWKIGGTDTLAISFANAKVATVSMGVEGVTAETLAENNQYTVADYNTTGSTVTLTKTYLDSLTASNTYNVNFTFAAAADGTTYKPVTVQLHVNPADAQDAGIQNGTDMRTWKIGGTDSLIIQFANAKVETVAVGAEGVTAETLSEGNQYSVTNYGDNGQTVTFQKTFLDSLTASTTYNVNFTFQSANGVSFNPISVKLHVEPADPVATPEQTKKWTWNRAYELSISFDGRTPSGLDIDFGNENWTAATNNKDFRLNGNTITLLPAMVNGQSRWTAWGNGGYTFRVNFTSGESEKISVTVEGTAPTQQPAQPTATPVPGSTATPANLGPTSPVTGDETPIALYVAILVLLVAALAIVIILLTKKNRGRR